MNRRKWPLSPIRHVDRLQCIYGRPSIEAVGKKYAKRKSKAPTSPPLPSSAREDEKKTLGKRVLVWSAGVGTAVLTGVIVLIIQNRTPLGENPSAQSSITRATGPSSPSFDAKSSPVEVTAGYMGSFLDGDGTWVLPTSIGANPLAVVSGIAPPISALAPGMGGKVVSPAKFRMTLDNVSQYSVTIVSMRAKISPGSLCG